MSWTQGLWVHDNWHEVIFVHHFKQLEVWANVWRHVGQLSWRVLVYTTHCWVVHHAHIPGLAAVWRVTFSRCRGKSRVTLVTSVGFSSAILQAGSARVARITRTRVGRHLQVAFKLTEHAGFTQFIMSLHQFAHEKRKSRGNCVDSFLNAQRFKPITNSSAYSFKEKWHAIIPWVCIYLFRHIILTSFSSL